MKKCSNCKLLLNDSLFDKNKSTKTGLSNDCKQCIKIRGIKYRKTIKGFLYNIYGNQIMGIKKRKKRKNMIIEYSKEEFYKHYSENNIFISLFNSWKKSNYKNGLSPSFDRKKDNLGYSFSNLQILTWDTNRKKSYRDTRTSKLLSGSRPQKQVFQYTKEGKFLKDFVSVNDAQRKTGINHISKCCNEKRKTAGGYIWKFQ